MTKFVDVHSTAAVLDPGFTFSAYSAEMSTAANSIDNAANTIAFSDPLPPSLPTIGTFQLLWSNGTQLEVGITAIGSNSFTMNGMRLEAADGAYFALQGGGRIGLDADGDLSASSLRLTRMTFGSDQAGQIVNGSGRMNLEAGTMSGRITSMTFSWLDDNLATPALEWHYVTLKGSVSVRGDAFSSDFGTLTGRVSGFEWGTMTTDADGNPLTFAPTTTFSGLKMDAAGTLAGLESGGFDSLMAGLYAGSDVIDGTAGDDFLESSTGNDKVFGEGGNDHIDGGAGNDQLFGGDGDDHIVGGAGNDKIVDESGNNTVIDTEGNARVTTGAGHDDITTGAGNDKIVAGDGDNDVESGAGNDNIATGGGADFIFAGSGNDKVVAGDGANWVEGGAGNDVLRTGAGADVIYGGEGADKINGGGGSDVFVFDNLAVGGKDLINDFNAAEDFFALDTTVFTSLAGGITDANFIAGKTAVAADDYLIFDTQGGKLYYDADGSDTAFAAVQIAVVKGSLTGLDAGNFIDEATLFV
ncbi:Hemolysin-type calcium-binding repeat-containing protein [Aromatoleum tolulyticum]|uniref:Hemolysin-type calcium-binding repeat-containing protein n=1 Tax=Aromatoleum tolulyticum TaxID=34027 RepID=A0A1N7BXU1_9RHOO|nr:calcium-binding protein [Aromatoleum tolulyticum]SIR56158.1 Hemolysin-type calcium-binding repeat-containing protein [Aromatoleum tolulyticum]